MSNVTFTVKEINDVLSYLGDVPSKYSLDLITFIKGKANEQLAPAPEQKQPEQTPPELVDAEPVN